jgi:hypothetical protein
VGGPDIATYGSLMLGYAHIRGLKRKMLLLPGIPLWFMALGVDLMTPVPYPIAHALIDGLSADSVVKHSEALTVFPEVKLIDFHIATRDALEKTHPVHIERVWDTGKDLGSLSENNSSNHDSKETSEVWLTLKHEGCFIDHREMVIRAEPEKVLQAIKQLSDKSNWVIEMNQAGQILVCVKDQVAGKKWVEWRINYAASVTYMTQTVFFSPRGLPGFLYWYLLYPFHLLNFRGLIKSIAMQSETQ